MADWSHGYDVSVGYTYNFFREMAPDWLEFCAGLAGHQSSALGQTYRYLDLGCGQGFHLCVLAAASPGAEFVGVDFQDEHVAHANGLAVAAGLQNVRFVRADFLDLATEWPKDLGSFDYIALQGILSWLSPEVRSAAFACVKQASRPGALVCCGYNAVPGWMASIPFQHVANRLHKRLPGEAAISRAVDVFEQLRDANAPAFVMQPILKARLSSIAAHPTNYLAHEYLTDHWTPLWHSQVAQEFEGAGLTYVGPATVSETLLPGALPPSLLKIVGEEPDPGLREDLQDIIINQVFRRDIFGNRPAVKASGPVAPPDVLIHLLTRPAEGQSIQFETAFGTVTRHYDAMTDIIEALADGPKTFPELLTLKNPARQNNGRLLLLMLEANILGAGGKSPEPAAATAQRFNKEVVRRAAAGASYRHLAAAAIRGGAAAADLDLLSLDAWFEAGGQIDTKALAVGIKKRLENLGQQLFFEGQLVSEEDVPIRALEHAARFLEQQLPQWRRLGVVQ